MMRRPIPWKGIIIAMLSASAALFASVALIAAVEENIKVRQENVIMDPSRITGRRGYNTTVVIQSVDMKSRTMIGTIHSQLASQDIDMKFTLAPDLKLERMDGIIEDGVVVGASELRPGTTTDLVLGTRGAAFVNNSEDGSVTLLYLLYGTPFPHP